MRTLQCKNDSYMNKCYDTADDKKHVHAKVSVDRRAIVNTCLLPGAAIWRRSVFLPLLHTPRFPLPWEKGGQIASAYGSFWYISSLSYQHPLSPSPSGAVVTPGVITQPLYHPYGQRSTPGNLLADLSAFTLPIAAAYRQTPPCPSNGRIRWHIPRKVDAVGDIRRKSDAVGDTVKQRAFLSKAQRDALKADDFFFVDTIYVKKKIPNRIYTDLQMTCSTTDYYIFISKQ